MFKADKSLTKHCKEWYFRMNNETNIKIEGNSLNTLVSQGAFSNLGGTRDRMRKTRAKLALKMIQRSTASMGRFDRPRKGISFGKNMIDRQSLRINTKTDEETVNIKSPLLNHTRGKTFNLSHFNRLL